MRTGSYAPPGCGGRSAMRPGDARSGERGGGEEGRYRGGPDYLKKKKESDGGPWSCKRKQNIHYKKDLTKLEGTAESVIERVVQLGHERHRRLRIAQSQVGQLVCII